MRGRRWSCDLKRNVAIMHAYGLDKFHISWYTGMGLSTVEQLLAQICKGYVLPSHEPARRPPQQCSRILTKEDIAVCGLIPYR